MEQYSQGFQDFRNWLSRYPGIPALPSESNIVAYYLEKKIQDGSSPAVLNQCVYVITWANGLYGFSDPCKCPLVKNTLEAGRYLSAKPKTKKDPITPQMIHAICNEYAPEFANLPDLRLACTSVIAYGTFLRFDELHKLYVPVMFNCIMNM